MADVSQIKLPNGSVYDLIDEKSGYITAEYIENKTDYEIPVSRVGEIVVGETAIGTDSTNFPTSKAVVDYVDERVVQEMDAIDVGVIGIKANGTSLAVENGIVNIPIVGPNQTVGLMTDEYMNDIYDYIRNVLKSIPTSISQLNNDSGFITASDIPAETDPTVPAWAKASTKPTYTASEVGALPDSTVIPEDKVFIAIRGTTSLSDIFTAKDAGKIIFCKDGSLGVIWRFTGSSGSSIKGKATFERIDGLDGAESMHSLKYLQLSHYSGQESWSVFTRTIPYRTSDLTNDSGYLTASDIASVMTYKGTKANYAALPASGNTIGDVWHLTDTGAEWAWDGSAWQELGTAIDLSGYATKATTLAGYGITDAKIQNGTITLGSNTITPLTSFTETDPTVPSWAKQSSKPTYTAAEVGALPDSTVIPSKTSDLTNDSGFLTTDSDEKLKISQASDSTDYYLILGVSNTTATTRQYDRTGLKYYRKGGTADDSNGTARLTLGNNTASNTTGWMAGYLDIYGSTAYRVTLKSGAPTTDRVITLPDASGTIALTSDIPDTSSFLTSETDPVFSASAAAGITATDISNWNSKTSNTGTITSVKTTAGQHTTINVTSGAVNFNVPTHTSHLTNDSGYLTSTDIDLDNYVPIEKTIGDTTYTYEIDYDEFSTLRQVRIKVFRDSDKNAALTLSGGNGTAILAGGKATEIYNVVTPTSNDMAANKKYVDDSIPKVYSSTNTGGYLTMATLPIYDGTVV